LKRGFHLLFISLNPKLEGYVGGGIFAFLELLKTVSSPRIQITVLENSPTLHDAYGVEYDSRSFAASFPYQEFGGEELRGSKAFGAIKGVFRCIAEGITIVSEEGISAVISPNERMPNVVASYITARLTGRPCIILMHLLPAYEYLVKAKLYRNFGLGSIMRARNDKYGRLGMNGILYALSAYVTSSLAKRSICVTNNKLFEEWLRGTGEFKSVYSCPLAGINFAELDSAERAPKTFDALYAAGLISAEKGVFDALRAWRVVVDQNPALRLLLIGKCQKGIQKEIISLIATLGLKQNVLTPMGLEGVAERKTIWGYMKRSKVLLYPSVKDATPTVVMESLGCGTPVVMYDADYAKGVFQPSRVLRIVETGDIRKLAAEVISVLEGDSSQLEAEAVAYSQEFDIVKTTSKQMVLLQDILRTGYNPNGDSACLHQKDPLLPNE
jgi:glycosyltransferase involved in cell wall biosynthesis